MESKMKYGQENDEMLFAQALTVTDVVTVVDADTTVVSNNVSEEISEIMTEDASDVVVASSIDDASMNRAVSVMTVAPTDTAEAVSVLTETADAEVLLTDQSASSETTSPPTDEAMQVAAWLAYQRFDQDRLAEYRRQNNQYPTIYEMLEYYREADAEKKDGDDHFWNLFQNDPEYASWKIVHIEDKNKTTGFVAMLIETAPNTAVVAFRGTEIDAGPGQVIWDLGFADLGLGLTNETLQQADARQFLSEINDNDEFTYDHYLLDGHSLGGNLAVHALLTASEDMLNKIDYCYSLDGPGGTDDYIDQHREAIKKYGNIIKHYQFSFIGNLLNPIPAEGTVSIQSTVVSDLLNCINIHNLRYLVVENGYFVQNEDGINTVSALANALTTALTNDPSNNNLLNSTNIVLVEANLLINMVQIQTQYLADGDLYSAVEEAASWAVRYSANMGELLLSPFAKNAICEFLGSYPQVGALASLALEMSVRAAEGVVDTGEITQAISEFIWDSIVEGNFAENWELGWDSIVDNNALFEFWKGVSESLYNWVHYHGYNPIIGSDGNDTDLIGTDGRDMIVCNAGDDYAEGGEGNDLIRGGDGSDTLDGNAGKDKIYGGEGEDTISGGEDNDYLYGDEGTDTIHGDDGDDHIYGDVLGPEGTQGNDRLYGDAGSDTIEGGAGNDEIEGGQGYDYIYGGSDNDTIYGDDRNDAVNGSKDEIFGGEGNDTIYGQAGGDQIEGGNGINHLYGGEGDDTIVGGEDEDYIYGGNGIDTIVGGNGMNRMFGHEAKDYIYGGDDSDYIDGGEGEDELYGGNGINYLYGQDDNDLIHGGDDRDEIYGGYGDDEIYGANGENLIYGGFGMDKIHDGDNGSEIYGEQNDDEIYAAGGNDTIDGGEGNDFMRGDHGDDTYTFKAGYGTDTIYDAAGNNIINLSGLSVSDMKAYRTDGNGLMLSWGADSIILAQFFDGAAFQNYLVNSDGATIRLNLINEIYGTDGDDWIALNNNGVILHGGKGADNIQGGSGNDTLYGDEHNDTLNGEIGDDLLDGGTGDDKLYGGSGSDTYIFAKGYESDTVSDWDGSSIIRFKDITAEEITVLVENDVNLVVSVNGTGDELYIPDFKWNQGGYIFEFSDGTTGTVNKETWKLELGSGEADNTGESGTGDTTTDNPNTGDSTGDSTGEGETTQPDVDVTDGYVLNGSSNSEWLGAPNDNGGVIDAGDGDDGLNGGSGSDKLYGGAGTDNLYGNDGDDILDGGTGTDGLNGGNGTDTYIFAKGYGNDTVNEWGSDVSIIKLTDINSDEVTLNSQSENNLVISVNGTSDTLTISNYRWSQGSFTLEFADGAVAAVNKETWEMEYSQYPTAATEETAVTETESSVSETAALETVVAEASDEDVVQSNAETLTAIYMMNSPLATTFADETDNTIISDVTDSTTVADETDEVADQTDLQVMILTENMSAFADEDNVSDGINVADASADVTAMNQLLVNSAV